MSTKVKKRCLRIIAIFLCALFVIPAIGTPNVAPAVFADSGIGTGTEYFSLVANGVSADIYVDAGDYGGIIHAADNLTKDIKAVTDVTATLKNSTDGLSDYAVIAGSIGKSPVIDSLINQGKLDVSAVKGKWESYVIDYIANPIPGVKMGLVIAGSDKRGAIFGIYKISETIGVSPWGFFADSVPIHQDELLLPTETLVQGEPSVKYRGLFINDERQLEKWMEQYGPKNDHAAPLHGNAYKLTSKFYVEFFDMILRQYGNYMWPAMWNNAFFTDDPLNGYYANEYGVVVGLSHQEFMNCPDKEWVWSNQGSFDWISRNTTSTDKSTWNYVNRDNIIKKWTETMLDTKDYETIPTLGLRGLNDTTAISNQGVDLNVMLLNDVTAAQMQIIEDVGLNAAEQQMNVTIYKEVETFYYGTATDPNSGWKASVDENITLVVCDDNHGNTRALPMDINRERAGGFGMYYHFDYNGSPRSYRWIDSTPLEKIREQMMMAYDYGVDRIWITNVGCIKFNEPSIDYWFKLAYDVDKWGGLEGPEKAGKAFAEREFGKELADGIANVISEYVHMNGIRKPEIVLSNSFSGRYFDEWTRMVDRATAMKDKALAMKALVPPERMDAYYNMVLRPVLVVWNVWNLMMNIEKNHLYASVGVTAANDFAQIAGAGLTYEDFTTQYTYGDPRINDSTYATTVNTIKTWLGEDVIDASETPGDFYCVADGKYYGYYTRRNLTSPHAVVSNDNIYYIGLTTWNHRQANGSGGGAKWSIGNGTNYNQVTSYNAADTTQMCIIPQVWDAPSGTIPNAKNGQTVALHKFTNYGDETRYVEVAATGNEAFAYTVTADQPWIVLSKTGGSISADPLKKIDKVYVSIDWEKITTQNPGASITFTASNGNISTVTVTTETLNLDELDLPLMTFIETDNYMSILSNNYAKSVPAVKDGIEYQWTTLPDYGRERSSVKVTPSNPNAGYGVDKAHTPGVNSPYLEYNIYVKTSGPIQVITQWAPTNGIDPRQISTLNYAAQLDDGPITTVNSLRSNFSVSGTGWSSGVESAVHTFNNENGGSRCISTYSNVSSGIHTIRIYMVNDGIVLQKLLVGAGLPTTTSYGATAPTLLVGSASTGTSAVFRSYLGPPETFYTTTVPPQASSIEVDGTLISGFDAGRREFTLYYDLPRETGPVVTATPAESEYKVAITQANAIPGVSYVAISDAEGKETVYTINFKLNAPKLLSFDFGGEKFNAVDGASEYDVNVPNSKKNITVSDFSAANIAVDNANYVDIDIEFTPANGTVSVGEPCEATVVLTKKDDLSAVSRYKIYFGHMTAGELIGTANVNEGLITAKSDIRFSDGTQYNLVFAVYKDDKLIHVQADSQTLEKHGSGLFSGTIHSNPVIEENGGFRVLTTKAFLWDQNYLPAVPAYLAPKTQYYENLALNVPVRASTTESANPAIGAVDGNDATRWAASGGNYPNWIEVDLGQVCELDKIDVSWFVSGDRAYYYTVWARSEEITDWSTTGGTSKDFAANGYTQVVNRSPNTVTGVVSDSLSGVFARYLVIRVNGTSTGSGSPSMFYINVAGSK